MNGSYLYCKIQSVLLKPLDSHREFGYVSRMRRTIIPPNGNSTVLYTHQDKASVFSEENMEVT